MRPYANFDAPMKPSDRLIVAAFEQIASNPNTRGVQGRVRDKWISARGWCEIVNRSGLLAGFDHLETSTFNSAVARSRTLGRTLTRSESNPCGIVRTEYRGEKFYRVSEPGTKVERIRTNPEWHEAVVAAEEEALHGGGGSDTAEPTRTETENNEKDDADDGTKTSSAKKRKESPITKDTPSGLEITKKSRST